MASLTEIVEEINQLLKTDLFDDVSLNGLQLEGRSEVQKIAAAVDCGDFILERAIDEDADLLLVHHGLYWGKPLPITGSFKRSLLRALTGELSIIAQHLPLDAHAEFGNNALIAKLLDLSEPSFFLEYGGQPIAVLAHNKAGLSIASMTERLKRLPGADPNMLALEFGPDKPERVAIVTGSGADTLYEFERADFDTLITGESKQFAYHFARDNKLNAIFAGHYASETVGVQALAKHIAEKFALEWTFIDCPTGI